MFLNCLFLIVMPSKRAMDLAMPSHRRAGGSLSSEDWKVHADFWLQQFFTCGFMFPRLHYNHGVLVRGIHKRSIPLRYTVLAVEWLISLAQPKQNTHSSLKGGPPLWLQGWRSPPSVKKGLVHTWDGLPIYCVQSSAQISITPKSTHLINHSETSSFMRRHTAYTLHIYPI